MHDSFRLQQGLRLHLAHVRLERPAEHVQFLCVVVETLVDDVFVLTAYLTDRIKKGVPLWPTPNGE